jgi:hypothetical protein
MNFSLPELNGRERSQLATPQGDSARPMKVCFDRMAMS